MEGYSTSITGTQYYLSHSQVTLWNPLMSGMNGYKKDHLQNTEVTNCWENFDLSQKKKKVIPDGAI